MAGLGNPLFDEWGADVIRILSKYNYFKDSTRLDRLAKEVRDYAKDIWDEPIGTLISKDVNGHIAYEYVDENIATLILKGEQLLARDFSNEIPNDRLPFGGLHINTQDKKVELWYTIVPFQLKEWSSIHWPDWDIEFDFWGYEKHYQQIGLGAELKYIIQQLEGPAIQLLKEEIVNAEREPFIDKKDQAYRFRPRKRSKAQMTSEFEHLVRQAKLKKGQ